MHEYVGRFAPSPSGSLHRGSLLAALASYLQARSQNGRWLLRIEDLDPPREPAGAAAQIVQCLEAHHLHPSGAVSYQSQRHPLYKQALEQLQQKQRLYACACSRAQLRSNAQDSGSSTYSGLCRHAQHPEAGNALRLLLADDCTHAFEDAVLGHQTESLQHSCGDFVLRRRDSLYAYQLAVVVDDGEQGVTEVVRGSDLLDNTARQIHLQQALGLPQPHYMHIPLLRDFNGRKLSKQNHARPLDITQALQNLEHAWLALHQKPLPQQPDAPSFLQQASQHWDASLLTTHTQLKDLSRRPP